MHNNHKELFGFFKGLNDEVGKLSHRVVAMRPFKEQTENRLDTLEKQESDIEKRLEGLE